VLVVSALSVPWLSVQVRSRAFRVTAPLVSHVCHQPSPQCSCWSWLWWCHGVCGISGIGVMAWFSTWHGGRSASWRSGSLGALSGCWYWGRSLAFRAPPRSGSRHVAGPAPSVFSAVSITGSNQPQRHRGIFRGSFGLEWLSMCWPWVFRAGGSTRAGSHSALLEICMPGLGLDFGGMVVSVGRTLGTCMQWNAALGDVGLKVRQFGCNRPI
jgi:hypothetical protein